MAARTLLLSSMLTSALHVKMAFTAIDLLVLTATGLKNTAGSGYTSFALGSNKMILL